MKRQIGVGGMTTGSKVISGSGGVVSLFASDDGGYTAIWYLWGPEGCRRQVAKFDRAEALLEYLEDGENGELLPPAAYAVRTACAADGEIRRLVRERGYTLLTDRGRVSPRRKRQADRSFDAEVGAAVRRLADRQTLRRRLVMRYVGSTLMD